MSLTDREILELNELCNSLVDDNLTRSDLARLEQWIAKSDDARKFYVRAMGQSASLGHYASELQIEAPDLASPVGNIFHHTKWIWLALAASVVVGALWFVSPTPSDRSDPSELVEYVAKVTGVKSESSGNLIESRLGAFLSRGERFELLQGFAEITFDSGAVLVVEGPALLDVNSPWDATLHEGAITASVPSQAIGFRITNPAVEVVDLGTEFSMVADGKGAANVFVIQGEVEAVPGSNSDKEAILLHENESRRFSVSGASEVEVSQPSAIHSEIPNSFERGANSAKYIYWTLDERSGSVLGARSAGFLPEDYDLTLGKRASGSAHTEGFRNGGLRFDGRTYAKASFPGLSSNLPRTVGFWVQVPKDAALSEAYSMVAWRADSAKLGSRPVHIGWNRNPDEGPLGALRTDFSGGHAMGMTSLRDGLWHYVSIVFVPGIDPDAPVQVKQYVDGKLESSRVTPGPKLSIAARGKESGDPSLADVLWLGCRLGSSGPRKTRFRGALDELIITDRALDPSEISRLMDGQEIALPTL
ncbi:LamG-like jellyroll fold domain-containing protein [Bythopirellula polymerisocia]|uniref:FecR protein n=1 Tax=Bythopirellula polymerisocia TaxID=2528003 RepID=A0A5C6C6T6_9BACT|nr:LamG-like jellyroll fold domain-containing protein [Bythopirellula polymerisocia]TWU20350.1 FecR protein [Bythopirellula polymerisocia]